MKRKVLFLGSKPIGYNCLSYLITNQEKLGIKIEGVLSNDNPNFGNASVKMLAADNNIPIINELDDILLLKDVDFLISVQYHQILKQTHIDVAKQLAINLHMAPLPELRGCNQFSVAILNDFKEFGTTLHQLETGIDNGAIIAESRFAIPENCFVKTLYDLTYEASLTLFEREIGNILSGNYTLTSQEKLIPARGTSINYRKNISKLKEIDLDGPADLIYRQVRATAMPGFEPPYAIVDGTKIYIIPESIYPKTN